jgi:hypothetical protein
LVGMVGFCGSRALPPTTELSALVGSVVGSVLSGGREVAVGCAVGGDALVVSLALAAGASSRLHVFAAFGPVSPAWPSARVCAPGASSSVSSVSGVASALAAGACISWWSGGGSAVPLAVRLAQHANESRVKRSAITCAIRRYGRDAFAVEVLAECEDQDALNAAEAHYVQALGTMSPSGYNIRPGGGPQTPLSPESRRKLAEAKRGIK